MAKKSTTKKDKPEAEKWLDKIDRARRVREDWHKSFRIGLCYEYWEGRQRPQEIPDNEWITINMIYSNLQAELPSLYATDPYYYIKLKTSYSTNPMDVAMFEARAKVRQSFVNYLKGELKLKDKARLSIFDAHFQYGVCKVVYSAEMVENPNAGLPIIDDISGAPLMGENGPILEPDTIPTNEAYKILRLHPDDFLVDEDAGPLEENVTWKAERIKRPLEEVKEDQKYTKKGRDAVKATEIKNEAEQVREKRKKGGLASGDSDSGETPDTVVLWEIYDRKNNQWCVVAEGCSEFLIEPVQVPAGIEKDPYIDLRFTKRDDSWYPLPPVSQWVDPQRDYCEFRSKLKSHLKRFNRKYSAYVPGLDDESELSKLESGEDGTIIKVNNPGSVIAPIADAPYDQQLHTNIAYLRHDFEDVALGANQRGSSTGVDSATEAGILEKRTQLREGDKQGLVLDFLTDIGRKLDQVVQANITKDQAVKVSGVQGEFWELVKTSDYQDINGEYEYSISTGSTTPQLPEIERAQWGAFLGLLAQAPWIGTSKQLLKRTAEMYHLNDEVMLEEIYRMATMMVQAQMQAQQMKAGGTGGLPGVPQQNPIAMQGGAAAGINNIRGGAS